MITEIDNMAVQQSYGRLMRQGTFFERFYEIFIASSREVASKLKDTDLEKQSALLEQAISMALLFSQNNVVSKHTMDRLRESHNRHNLDISPRLYSLWLDSLIKAAAEQDPEFTPKLEEQWRKMMHVAIDYIIAGH